MAAASSIDAIAPGFIGVFVEAMGEVEGPGRVRVKLAEDAAWGEWHDCGNIARIMWHIGVDARWCYVKENVRAMIAARQDAAFEAWLAAECTDDVENTAGYTAGKACFHAGRLVPKRVFPVFDTNKPHPTAWWRAFALAIVHRTAGYSLTYRTNKTGE